MAFAEAKLTGVDGVLDMLKSLPAEVVSKRGGPAKTALRKGATVIAKAEKLALQATLGGADDESTGLLMSSVIVSRGKPPTSGKGERYLVRIKNKSYQRKGARVTTLKTAHLKEFGSSQQPAEPFVLPAFQTKAPDAISTIERELVTSVDRIAQKLMRQGGA